MIRDKMTIVLSVVCILLFIVTIITDLDISKFTKDDEIFPISDYKLYPADHYNDITGNEIIGILKTTSGEKLYVKPIENNVDFILGYIGNTSYELNAYNVSDNLAFVTYYPNPNVIYGFGQDKPINIYIATPAAGTGNRYDSPTYTGYYDGTCEYPGEFYYVDSKTKCEEYLQDILDFVGFQTVDELLEYSFGEYITKENIQAESEI